MRDLLDFIRFCLMLLRRSFHGPFKWVEGGEALLALVVHSANYFSPEWGEELAILFPILLALLAVTFVVSLFWSAYRLAGPGPTHVQLERVQAQRDALQSDFDAICDANTQILHQGGAASAKYAVLERELVLKVERDGSLTGSQQVLFQAESDISMVDITLAGESPIHYFSDLAFAANSDGTYAIVSLPARPTPYEKRMLLVFLPQVPAGATVRFSYSWRWPKLWERLLQGQADSWSHEVRSEKPVRLLRFRFKLAKGIPPVKLRNIGRGGGQSSANPVDKEGYSEYVWEMTNVTPGIDVEIRLER